MTYPLGQGPLKQMDRIALNGPDLCNCPPSKNEELFEKFGFSHVIIILSPSSIAMRKFSQIKVQGAFIPRCPDLRFQSMKLAPVVNVNVNQADLSLLPSHG